MLYLLIKKNMSENLPQLENKIKKIYLTENKKLLMEKDSWLNTTLDIIGIIDPTGIADFSNGLIRISKGDYFFGFLSLISAVPYVGDLVAKPIMGISKGSKLYQNVDKALKLSKAGDAAGAAKLLNNAAQGSKLMNRLVAATGRWAEKIKSGIDALPLQKLTSGPRNMIKDWCDLFIQVAKRRRQFQAITKGKALKILADPQAATGIVKNLKQMMDKGFLRNVQLSRLKNVSFFKPWSSGWMAKYVWPTTTFGLLYRNRDIVSLSRRTRFYWGFIDYISQTLGLTLPDDVTPQQLYKYTSENEIENKFKQYVNSPEGQKYWDEDMSGVNPSSLGLSEPQQSLTNKSLPDVPPPSSSSSAGGGDIIDNLIDAILS